MALRAAPKPSYTFLWDGPRFGRSTLCTRNSEPLVRRERSGNVAALAAIQILNAHARTSETTIFSTIALWCHFSWTWNASSLVQRTPKRLSTKHASV